MIKAASLAAMITTFFLCNISIAGELNQGLFSERNSRLLNRLILENGSHSPGYNAARRPYIVVDWDNTSAFGDAEETLTWHMLDNLSYTLSVSEFRRAVSLNVPEGESKLLNDAGRPVVFDDLVADLVEDYSFIYSNYSGFAGRRSLDRIKASEEYKDFAAKLFVMFDALDATRGTAVADQWQGQLMSGMTGEQLMRLSEKSIRKNLAGELRKIKLSSSNRLKRRCNGVSSTTFQGLRTFPDMANLYRASMENGIDVYVVSASPEEIIVPVACNAEYGYRIPRENVYGARFAKNNGVLQPELSTERLMTWGPGKVDLIRNHFIASKGYPSLLVCGDSDGDYDMLADFEGTKLSLIVNRLKKGRIGGLCELAARQIDDPNPRYILQGIDENTGLFSPGEATLKFGTTEKAVMK